MGIEISGNGGRPSPEAIEAGKTQANPPANRQAPGASGVKVGGGTDQLELSNQAAHLQALEAEIANLPVVDTQRVQDVQRTMATGTFQVQPAKVADKLLAFEAGLGPA